MKKITYITLAFATALSAASCGSSDKETTAAQEEKTCMYTYDHASSVLEWTAFKFTEKKGVTGSFTTVTVTDGGAKENPEEVIESLSFSIPVATVETQNPDRNAKIAKFFFGTIHTEAITGKVKDLKADGKALLEITMNAVTKEVEGTYTLNDGAFAFHATINVIDWNGQPGIDALNKECKDLHTGTDGVSKLWSEVELSFTTTLKSDCE